MKFGELIGMFKESNKVTKSHMKNLFEMAMVDSNFDDTEFELLEKLAKKHKVSEKELNEIKENPDKIPFELRWLWRCTLNVSKLSFVYASVSVMPVYS